MEDESCKKKKVGERGEGIFEREKVVYRGICLKTG